MWLRFLYRDEATFLYCLNRPVTNFWLHCGCGIIWIYPKFKTLFIEILVSVLTGIIVHHVKQIWLRYLYRNEATFINCLRRLVYKCGYVLAILNKQRYWRNTINSWSKIAAIAGAALSLSACLPQTGPHHTQLDVSTHQREKK